MSQSPTDIEIVPYKLQLIVPDGPATVLSFLDHYSEVTERIKHSLAKLHDKDIVWRPEDIVEWASRPMLQPQPNVNQVK